MLEKLSSKGITLVRSRSFDSDRGTRMRNSRGLFASRSCGSSPVRELGADDDWEGEKARLLDMIDGLDMHASGFS